MDRHLHVDRLRVPARARSGWGTNSRGWRWRIFREWCFARVMVRRLGLRLAFLAFLLVGGALLLRVYEPQKKHNLLEAAYHTWFLILGNPTEELPDSPLLQLMFILLPLAGLMIFIESLVELSMLLRDRRNAEQPWNRIMASSMSGHVVLVGMGKLGYRTFLLLRKLGRAVAVVDKNPQGQFLDEVRRDGSPLLIGDGRRDELLKQAGIARACAIVLATEDDLANLEMALDARRFNPSIRVVLRMFDQNMADKVAGAVNIRLAMSQSAISAPAFATAAIEPSIISCSVIEDRLIVMVKRSITPGDPLSGRTVGEAAAALRCVVVSRRVGDRSEVFPAANTVIGVNEDLVLQGTYEQVPDLVGGA